jgi:hypothetical protein
MRTRTFAIVSALLFGFFTSKFSGAQDLPPGFKNWAIGGITAKVSPKTSLGVSQLYAFNTGPYNLQFVQSTFSAGFKLSKKFNLDFGYADSRFKSGEEFKHYHRVFTELDYSSKLSKNIKMKNSLKSEWHFPQLKKYRYRFIYSNKISFKNKFLPWRATPYIRNQVYYYLDGKATTYYAEVDPEEEIDEEGATAEEGEVEIERIVQAPSDFHRYRLTLGVRMRPAKGLYLSVYYIMQKEFNTPFTEFRDLNTPNRTGTRTKIPFNNYSLVGVSLNYQFKTYRKKNTRKPKLKS